MGLFDSIAGFLGAPDAPDYPGFPGFTEEEKRFLSTQEDILELYRSLLDFDKEIREAPSGGMKLGYKALPGQERDTSGVREAFVGDKTYDQIMGWFTGALGGKDYKDPALERSIEDQEKRLKEVYSRKLGPGYEKSTPYIQAQAELQKNAMLSREEAREADKKAAYGMLSDYRNKLAMWQLSQQEREEREINRQDALKGRDISMLGNLFSAYGALSEPYYRQRMGEYGQQLQKAQGEYESDWNRLGFGAGFLMTTATGAAGSILGGPTPMESPYRGQGIGGGMTGAQGAAGYSFGAPGSWAGSYGIKDLAYQGFGF